MPYLLDFRILLLESVTKGVRDDWQTRRICFRFTMLRVRDFASIGCSVDL